MKSNTVSIGDTQLKLEHQRCSDPHWCLDKGIFIEANGDNNDTLSTITLNGYFHVYVYWAALSCTESFEVLYVPSTEVLFLGAGGVSAQISIKESKVIGVEFPCLFWGLERHGDFVIESGELECFLYGLDGKRISSAPVDPPYEMIFTEQGVKCQSAVMGTTWLRFDGLS